MEKWKENKINVAIQVLPEAEGKLKYALVDKAINVIAATGLKCKVCPFETVVECTFQQMLDLLDKLHIGCKNEGTERMLLNLKIQVDYEHEVTIEDKMDKYS